MPRPIGCFINVVLIHFYRVSITIEEWVGGRRAYSLLCSQVTRDLYQNFFRKYFPKRISRDECLSFDHRPAAGTAHHVPGPEPGGRREVRQRPAAVRGKLRLRLSTGIWRQTTVRSRYIYVILYLVGEC